MNKPKFTYTLEQLEYFRHCGRLGGMLGRKAKLTPERIKRMQDGRKKENKHMTHSNKYKCAELTSFPRKLNYCSSVYEHRFSCGFIAVIPCDSYSNRRHANRIKYIEKLHRKYHKTFKEN